MRRCAGDLSRGAGKRIVGEHRRKGRLCSYLCGLIMYVGFRMRWWVGVCAYVCLGECEQMAGAGMGFNRLRW